MTIKQVCVTTVLLMMTLSTTQLKADVQYSHDSELMLLDLIKSTGIELETVKLIKGHNKATGFYHFIAIPSNTWKVVKSDLSLSCDVEFEQSLLGLLDGVKSAPSIIVERTNLSKVMQGVLSSVEKANFVISCQVTIKSFQQRHLVVNTFTEKEKFAGLLLCPEGQIPVEHIEQIVLEQLRSEIWQLLDQYCKKTLPSLAVITTAQYGVIVHQDEQYRLLDWMAQTNQVMDALLLTYQQLQQRFNKAPWLRTTIVKSQRFDKTVYNKMLHCAVKAKIHCSQRFRQWPRLTLIAL